ncbi:hypothetical protein [Thomasclavelia spiroformis]|uniref:hypothetical protein n=1 Tax=Thomasclavelia spiroformis TaxID=29348 RepID=UPI0024B204E5|nr:hypothetical protein [Thomasclavelia spiroformis]
MKRSRRYIKKQQKKELNNKKVLQRIIRESNICQHAIKVLKLAGYGKEKGGPNNWMYQQVLEAVAVFASHGNSGSSAPFEINFVQKLCNWDIISPLTFKDNEWRVIDTDGCCQNIRKSSIFKEADGTIYDIDAFTKVPKGAYRFDTKQWEKNDKGFCWKGGLFEHKNNILTGRYFSRCNLLLWDIDGNYVPKSTRKIPCVEVEISPDNWIMAVDADNTELILLSCDYHIDWKECPCMRDVRLEDVTPSLEELAYEQIKTAK